MPYDHSTKIGNEGDLVKHIALFAALQELTREWPRDRDFAYAETHAGRPRYVLPADGEWQRGIGEFSKVDSITAARKERKKGLSTLGCIGTYDEQFVGRPMSMGMLYPGSSAIAFHMLRARGIKFRMKLWDTDRGVADDLVRYYYPWRKKVAVMCDNGYRISVKKTRFDFVLIDPPSTESDSIVPTVSWLKERRTNFIVWTPLTSASGVRPSEAEDSRDYAERVKSLAVCFCITWRKRGHQMPGCCIAASHGVSVIIGKTLERTATIMGWTLDRPQDAAQTAIADS